MILTLHSCRINRCRRPVGLALTLTILLVVPMSIACPAGPTPERVGFSYPEFGVEFAPRRHVVSRARGTEITPVNPTSFTLLFPRVTSEVENPHKRLLFTAVKGEWSDNRRPLFDEISVTYYGMDPEYQFALTDERTIDVPWPGVASKTGTLRVFHMTPLQNTGGTPQYTFAVTVSHYGNTFEICWREARDVAPDQQKMDDFFYWTRGLRFFEPVPPKSQR